MAKRVLKSIQKRLPGQPTKSVATERPAHAEEITYRAAVEYDKPLILSSSGDGGYHEVVNGIMRAKQAGHQAIAGLIPAGNANDHYHATMRRELVDCIVERKIRPIDLLVLQATSDGLPLRRYGHSYIGLGVSPRVGKKLNKTKLNAINQYLIAAKILFRSKPVDLQVAGEIKAYDSLILSNIDRMAKLLTLSRDAKVDDGKFEVTAVRDRDKWQLIKLIFKAAAIGLDESWQTNQFEFATVRATDVQIDGEIYHLEADSSVAVTIDKHAIMRVF